jgi:hypothetical protein
VCSHTTPDRGQHIARLKAGIAGLRTADALLQPSGTERSAPARQPPPTSRSFARRHDRPVAGVRYTPRRPENSILHRVVRENLPAFLDQAEQASNGLRFPEFVLKELDDLLTCGDFRRGLALFRCSECNSARAVPLSCKSRALCPSCGAKRMKNAS